jgi:hypothetical protein
MNEPYKTDCRCSEPHCAKCLSSNCKDKDCLIHTKEAKIAWRRNWELANNKVFPEADNF